MGGRRLTGTSVVRLVALGACAIVGRSAGADPGFSHITNAEPDLGDPHVVAIQYRRISCGLGATPDCSGILIAPRVVLTAAHCVDTGAQGIQLFFGSSTDQGGDVLYPSDVLAHPYWDEATGENDLALVALPYAVSHTPALLLDSLDDTAVGKTVRLVGFGADGEGGAPGIKRSGEGTISQVDALEFRITPSPSMSCEADSGGPVFLTVDGTEYLAGVTAWGDPSCVDYGVNVRVDAHWTDFIEPGLAQLAGLPDDTWTEVVETDTDAVCELECLEDDDCPDGMECTDREDGTHCRYQGLPSGYFDGATCADDGDCDGMCVALASAGQPECTCYAFCDLEETPPRGKRCGCAGTEAPSAWWSGLLVLVAAGRRKRR